MIWVSIAAVLSAVVALVVMVSFEIYVEPGFVHEDFAAADPNQRWHIAFYVARADWQIIRGAQVLPSLAIIIIGSFWAIRSLLYYAFGGGLALACIPFVIGFGNHPGGAAQLQS